MQRYHVVQKDWKKRWKWVTAPISDVLTLDTDNLVLITGLSNLQAIRTSEMADIRVIVLVRNKKANQQMLDLAIENEMCILESPYSLFKASGLLFQAGLKPIY